MEQSKSLKDIGEIFSVDRQTVKRHMLKIGVILRTKSQYKKVYSYNEQFFSKPNVLNSYWAGFIAADFYIRKSEKKIR